MWELVSRKLPWGDIAAADLEGFKQALLAAILSGRRPPTADADFECPAPYAALMRRCWSTIAADRPNFDFIVAALAE